MGRLADINKSIFMLGIVFNLSACSMQSSIKNLLPSQLTDVPEDTLQLKVGDGESQEFTFNEGTAVVFIVSQNIKRDVATSLELTIEPVSGEVIADSISQTLPITASIEAGQLNTTLSLSTIHDVRYSGERKFKVILSSTQDQVSTNFILKLTDLEAAPSVQFTQASQVVTESTASSQVTVTLNRVSTMSVAVPFVFNNNSAINGTHFTASNSELTFAPGETSKTISWSQIDNAVTNSTRDFSIALQTSSSQFTLGSVATHQVQITDDESPTLSISDVSVNQGSSATMTVTLNPVSFQTVTVNYQSVNQTATAGTHYTASSGTLTFAAGESSKTVTIATSSITVESCGPARTLNFQLSTAVNANIGISSSTVTINDPKLPTISIADGSGLENSTTPFVVSLDKACTTQNVTFTYSTSNGSAVAGTDYQSTSAAGSITAGQTSTTLNIANIDDSSYQGDRQFTLTLSSLGNAQAGDLTAAGTVQDNESPMGAFSISGITSDFESTQDANLSNALEPIVHWGASTNATSYDVSVLADDGTTVVCALQNTTNTQYDFSVCSLTAATYYKAKVTAKAGTDTLDASNSLYRFYVNRSPTLGSGGNGTWFIRAGNTLTINAQWAASPAVGVAQDADGDTLSFTTTGSASLGIITNNGTYLSYVPTSTNHGVEQFTYVISDSRGGTLTGTITIHVMQQYTWIGAVSAVFETAGNWCGNIAANFRSCVGSATVPNSSTHHVFIDETCASSFTCSPQVAANRTIGNLTIATNKLTINSGISLTMQNLVLSKSGEFDATLGAITVNDISVVSNSVFKLPTGTATVRSFVSTTGAAVVHNGGLVQIRTNAFISLEANRLNNVQFMKNGTFGVTTINGVLYVDGNLSSASSGSICTVNGQVELQGNLNISAASNTFYFPSIKLTGANQTITADTTVEVKDLDFNTANVTIATGSTLVVSGNLTRTSGTFTANNSTVVLTGSAKAINVGNIQFRNLEIACDGNNYLNRTLTGQVSVLGDLTFSCNNYSGASNGGEYLLYGNLIQKGTTFGGGSSLVRIMGNPAVISALNVGSIFPRVQIESPGDVIFDTANVINFSEELKYISGNVTTTGSTVRFTSPSTIDTSTMALHNVTLNISNSQNITVVGNLLVNGNLTMGGNTTPRLNGGIIYVRGNLAHTGSVSGGSSEIILDGTGDQTVSKVNTSYHFPGTQININKSSGKVLLSSNVTLSTTQTLNVYTAEYFDLNTFNLSVKNINLNGNTLYKRTGTFSVNGSAVTTTGAMFGGTVLDN